MVKLLKCCFKKNSSSSENGRLQEVMETALVRRVQNHHELLEQLKVKLSATELQFLGAGSYGEVFAVIKANSQETEADESVVKIVRARNASQEECGRVFLSHHKEHEILQMLQAAPGFIKVFTAFAHGRSPCGMAPYYAMVLEKCEQDLFQFLRDQTLASRPSLVNLAMQTLSALEYMHSLSVAHHDIKPDNIMIKRVHGVDPAHFTYKIIDFGLAKHYPGIKCDFGTDNRPQGTVMYMAPEKHKHSDADQYNPFLADVYALGLTMIHCSVGLESVWSVRELFAHEQLDTIDRQLNLIPWMGRRLKKLLIDMTKHESSGRLQASEAREKLESFYKVNNNKR